MTRSSQAYQTMGICDLGSLMLKITSSLRVSRPVATSVLGYSIACLCRGQGSLIGPIIFNSYLRQFSQRPVRRAAMPTGKLYCLGDIHLGHPLNGTEWSKIRSQPNDGLILAGDVGETDEHLRLAFSKATECFGQVFWIPGNHELYTIGSDKTPSANLRGEAKYQHCVDVAREYGVLTPEDEWAVWDGEGGPAIIALCFGLYDYSFRPEGVSRERALDWANEENVMATDEALLHADPFPSRDEWCHYLVRKFESKFEAVAKERPNTPIVIVNHWPLREDTIFIPLVPRFTLWCGTKKTADWHKRWNVKVVATGHLHVRRSDWIDGVRFEECSLGYPRQWKDARDSGKEISDMMREILPGNSQATSGTVWRRFG